MRPLAAAVLLFVSPLLVHVSAQPVGPCDSGSQASLHVIELPATGVGSAPGNPHGIYYIDDRNYVTGNGLYIYEESNGVYSNTPSQPIGEPGDLQRGQMFVDPPTLTGTSSMDPCTDEFAGYATIGPDASVLPGYF